MKIYFWVLICLFLPTASWAKCSVAAVATVPLRIDGGLITVTVAVNHADARFVLDTGAQRSLVTPAAAARLDLARDKWVGTTMGGIGGFVRRPNADPTSLTLGGVPLVRRTLTHDTSLTVGLLPNAQAGAHPIDGLLGRDFLSSFDLDLHVPEHSLTLYQVAGCAGRFAPWAGPYDAVSFTEPANEAIVLPVAVNGHPLRALLDTGASASLIAAPGMYKLGLDPAAMANDPVQRISGLGPRTVTVHRHQFRSLAVGTQTTFDPSLWVEPIRLMPIVDMLLGADWLQGRHVWISYATKQIFFSGD